MSNEQTLSIIKPDAVAANLIGAIYQRFEDAGLKIVAAKMMHLSEQQAAEFYAVHREKPFFRELVDFMVSGPIMVQVLEGRSAIAKNRELMGATFPRNAEPGTEAAAVDTSVTAYKAAHGPSQSYSLLLALQGSLREIVREGPERVIARHAAAGRALRAGVRAMGLEVLADESIAASCATCVVMPGASFPTHEYMRTVWREHGIATAGGSQEVGEMGYAGSRVGLMGFVANLDSVCALLLAMERVLPRYGVPVQPGCAVAAARATATAATATGAPDAATRASA